MRRKGRKRQRLYTEEWMDVIVDPPATSTTCDHTGQMEESLQIVQGR